MSGCRAKARLQAVGLEELEKIPPHDAAVALTVESYATITKYLRKVGLLSFPFFTMPWSSF
jgi:hypothetical protein